MDDDEDGKHKHFNYDKIVEHQNLSKQKRKKLLKSNTPLEDDDFQVRNIIVTFTLLVVCDFQESKNVFFCVCVNH